MSLQAIKYYKNLQKHYSRRINLDLGRIKKVLNKLNNPHLFLNNPINILGSDGKMSVLTSLKFFLEANKKKITCFTSPHLYDPCHRIWLKNKHISLKEINFSRKIIEKTNVKLTLFELLTCIYIIAARRQKDISHNLVESGLLFKKDSTNLWSYPKAQIVTNINFQHQEWVNPKTIKEICKQKVGYLSKNTVIYIAKQKPQTLRIIKKILKSNPSKIVYASSWKLKKEKNYYIYKDKNNVIPIKSKFIHSDALLNNLCLAIKVALDFGIKKEIIIKTIPKIKFEGRLQYLKKGRLIKKINYNENLLLDGCHSISSGANLNNYLKSLKKPIYGIWGMQKNKMPEKFIKIFKKNIKKLITIKIPNEPNAIDAKTLSEIAKKYDFKVQPATNIYQAIKKISDNKRKTIVIFGSLYLIGDVLKKNSYF